MCIRDRPTDHEEAERGDEVEVADHLVIGRGDPPDHRLTRRPATWGGLDPQRRARSHARHQLPTFLGRYCWSPCSIFSRLRLLSSMPTLPWARSAAMCAS